MSSINWDTRLCLRRGIVNTHYKVQGYALQLANAFGFLFPAEVFLLQSIVRSLHADAVLVTIGAGAGTNSLAMAEIHPGARLYTVDISEGGPLGGFSNERNAFSYVGIKPYPVQILGNSQVVHAQWPEISGHAMIDLLFIDGDHTVSALQGDIDGWLPYVHNGGYVLFHDYQSVMWGDVTGVVDANMNVPGWRYVHQVDTLIAFQRGGGR